jgi:hypothetical protein
MRRILQTLHSTQTAFAAILLFGLLAMTTRNATDPDLWWHLRTGQWIVETGHVPRADPFSSLAPATHGCRMSGCRRFCFTNSGSTLAPPD